MPAWAACSLMNPDRVESYRSTVGIAGAGQRLAGAHHFHHLGFTQSRFLPTSSPDTIPRDRAAAGDPGGEELDFHAFDFALPAFWVARRARTAELPGRSGVRSARP